MPFTPAQFVRGMDYTIRNYDRVEPVDQINTEHPFLTWLLANRKDSLYGNGLFGNPVYVSNNSNYQRYFGADAVTYNERDPVRQALFPYVNAHDGFWFDEDTLAANNIVINDDGLEAPTSLEKGQLVNLLGQSWRALREGMQENLALDALQDGSQSVKAVAGLDAIVSTTPTVGTVGDLSASASWWQNNIGLGLAQAALIETMETIWRACLRYGKVKPTKIICGAAFMDDYRAACKLGIGREIIGGGPVSMDGGVTTLSFKNVELVWDPDFEALDALLGAITHPWTKRCYFLNERNITMRPFKGRWMVNRKPERLPDRYVHYAAKTASWGMTTNKRNSMAVLSID